MGSFEPLTSIVEIIRILKVDVLDALGPLAPTVTGAGQILAAGVSIFLLIAGKGFWAPSVPGLAHYAVRLAGLAAGLGILVLHRLSKSGSPVDFTLWAVLLVAVGLAFAILYLYLRLTRTFRCPGDKNLYVRGSKLQEPARRLLNNELEGLPPQYLPRPGDPVPANATEFFCRGGKQPERVWTIESHARAVIGLVVAYFFVMVPLAVGLASGSISLTQVQQVVETPTETHIDLNSDVLFDFDKDTIRDAALPGLEEVAKLLRERPIRTARIEGHTDSKGSEPHNLELSVRRATSVRDWLAGPGRLTSIQFDVKGYGATIPVAPNTRADTSDNPEGRQKNRRVTIVVDK